MLICKTGSDLRKPILTMKIKEYRVFFIGDLFDKVVPVG